MSEVRPPIGALRRRSLTSTPRPLSSRWAASMSVTIRKVLRVDPGRASVSPVPIWIEQVEPRGVSCTTRKSLLG